MCSQALTAPLACVQGDARSVDELLNFIGGEGQGEAAPKAKPKKKKGKKRGKGTAEEQAVDDTADADGAQAPIPDANAARHAGWSARALRRELTVPFPRSRPRAAVAGASAHELFPEDGFDDDDGELGSDIEPELLAKLDQEVEEFTRRLNANWKPRTAAPPPQASVQSAPDGVAAVRSLLTSCLQSLGLADQLKVCALLTRRDVALTGV